METGLSEVLDLIQDNPTERPGFAQSFIEMLQGQRASPEWLISYCMRTLRWPEIRRAAEAVVSSGHPKLLSLAWEVVDTYDHDDDWPGQHLFDRYDGE
jgi:hypothetical protein